MCYNCGYNPCHCSNTTYPNNWFTVPLQSCDPCDTTDVCKRTFPAKCTIYNGPNLTGFSLTTNINIELILATASTLLSSLQQTIEDNQVEQGVKNTNILTALNDINTRINSITGGSHPAYTI